MRQRFLLATVVTLLLSFALEAAQAIPRYSARYRQNCNLCHHNPTGGGMRGLYASLFLLPNEMVMVKPSEKLLEGIRPDISESVTIGADIRMAHHYSKQDRPPPEVNFFQMQGDLYLRLQAGPRFSAYIDRGMSTTLEIFGMAYVLPWNGFVKFGRFTPAFGWKLADHRQFVRQRLFFEPPSQTDVGVEVGIYPGRFSLIASAINGAGGAAFDTNDILAYTVRGAYRFDISSAGFLVGASYWRNSEFGGRRTAGGPFGYFNLGPFTWIGELDWSNLSPSGETATTEIVSSHEFTWQLLTGLDLRATYNFADPDLDRQTGTLTRYGLGFDTLITPFFGIKAMMNRYDNETGLDVTEDSYTQSELILHLLY